MTTARRKPWVPLFMFGSTVFIASAAFLEADYRLFVPALTFFFLGIYYARGYGKG